MIFEVDFGAPQTGIGYQFEDSGGGAVGSRVTTGITPGSVSGTYFATAAIPSGAVSIYWDCVNPLFTAEEDIPAPPAKVFSPANFGIRTSNFLTDFLYGVAAILSINPDKAEFSNEFVRQWTSFLNTKLPDVWEMWDFPELLVTEERAFRTVWRNDTNYFAGDEVYSVTDTNYYVAQSEVPEGTDPTIPSVYWLLETTIDKYIAYDQLGQRPIGEMLGVYNVNPRFQPYLNCPGLPFRPSEKGIDVWPCTAPTVFVNYKILPSKFTSEDWVAGMYNYGDTVFYGPTGNCYQCGVRLTSSLPTDSTQWFVVPFPTILLGYLIRAVAGDAADDIQTETQLLAEAEDLLHGKLATLGAQGQKFRYHFSRRRDRMRDGWCGSWPWSGGFVSTLTNAVYSPLPQERRPSWITEGDVPIVTETEEAILVP